MHKKMKFFISIILIVLLITIFIVINNKKYEVNFNIDQGTIVNQFVKKGNKLIKPEDPKKEGYDFVGWEVDGEIFDFNTKITKDIILKPVWKKQKEVKFTVIFDSNGGNEISNQYTNRIVKENIIPKKEGYKFLGWFYNDEIFDLDSEIKSDIILIAKWEKNKKLPTLEKPIKIESNIVKPVEKPQQNEIKIEKPILEIANLDNFNGNVKFKIDIINLNKSYNYEVYEIINNNYVYIKEIKKDYIASIKLGDVRKYSVKAYYINENNKKIFSDYSNIVKIDNTKIETPKISIRSGDNRDNFNVVANVDFIYWNEENKEEEIYKTLYDGFEVFEKIDDKYKLLEDVKGYIKRYELVLPNGLEKTIKIRTYVYNSQGNKVYSDFSNELYTHNKLETPKIKSMGGGYTNKNLLVDGITVFHSDDYDINRVDGFEVYKVVQNDYVLIGDSKRKTDDYSGFEVASIYAKTGEQFNISVRTYTINNNERIYSDYSDLYFIENPNLHKPKLIVENRKIENNARIIGFTIDTNELWRLDGYELYEISNNNKLFVNAGKVTNDLSDYKTDIIYATSKLDSKKEYVARTYILDGNNKIYSDYSDILTIHEPTVETPIIEKISENLNQNMEMECKFKISNINLDKYKYEIYSILGNNLNLENVEDFNNINFVLPITYTKDFVVKSYLIDNDGNKIYSEKSNIIRFDNKYLPKPNIKLIDEKINSDKSKTYKYEIVNIEDYKNFNVNEYKIFEYLDNGMIFLESGVINNNGFEITIPIGVSKKISVVLYNFDVLPVLSTQNSLIEDVDNSLIKPILQVNYNYNGLKFKASSKNIDGYEIYKLENDEYKLVGSYLIEENELNYNYQPHYNDKFVARAFIINKNEKVYSNYSNILSVNETVLKPKLDIRSGSELGGYIDAFPLDIENEKLKNTWYSGWELYEKIDGKFTLINNFSNNERYLVAPSDKKRTFMGRIYLIDEDGNKVFSEYSDEFIG